MNANVNKIAGKPVMALPPPPCRYTEEEWYNHTIARFRLAEDQNLLADRILEDSARVIDNVREKLEKNKEQTEMRMKEKIRDLEFARNEIENSRKILNVELEALGAFKERIQDALQSIRISAKRITEKCCVLREGRIGIDLVQDYVEVELKKEIKTIDGAEMILQRTLEQLKEMMREIRATLYLLTRDLEDKMKTLAIETECLNMKTTNLDLSLYHGTTPLDASDIAYHEWQHYTENIFLSGFKKVNNARNFRNTIDRLLREAFDDLRTQYAAVNEAFQRRIEEQKEMKTKLEKQLFEVNRQVNEMTRNITELEKAIAEKEGYLALAHTRLGRRAHRPQVELNRDEVETRLVNEVVEIREYVGKLQHMLCEAQANQRYLCKTQIQLQEDINIKINSIKIDEVDCMTIRQGLDYHSF
ncbi:UNVERIFIED_CONTAM: hypothetical protein PYX00_005229 [Menopon gallinae]|uniref:Tektin n=1 Tax=Menopon gallinae TaxID=328185 RepID=A0AAW2HQA2_9NEOP